TRQIGMARTRRSQLLLQVFRAFAVLNGQYFLPVFPVAVFDAQRDWRANRLPVTNTGQKLRRVLLDFLPSAAAISQLAPMQFALNELHLHGNTGWEAGNPCNQRLAVGFTRRHEA